MKNFIANMYEDHRGSTVFGKAESRGNVEKKKKNKDTRNFADDREE